MPKLARLCVPFLLFFLFAILPGTYTFAQQMIPNSVQVSRVQYDGDTGNVYVSPYSFPEIFNDPAGLTTGNGIQDIAGIQGSIYIDQFNSVPSGPMVGPSLGLPSTGPPASYPTVEPGSYITTSFSSKSEGALMLSVDGQYLTYFGYEANDQLNDVSNSYSPNPTYELSPNSYTLDPTLGTPITITAASDSKGGNATMTLSSPVTVPSGAYFTIAGMSTTGYNGTWATLEASTSSTTIELTGLPGKLTSCTSATACGGTATYDPPYPFYDREVALINSSGLVSLTPIDNADSGDNPRAALTVDGNELYTAGNSDSTCLTYPCEPTTSAGNPGLTIGVRCALPENNLSYQLGTYISADRPDESTKKHVKDNNWRGIGIFADTSGNQQLYVSKGSGSNGDDGVFQVQDPTTLILPVCTEGGTDTSANFNIIFSAPATVPGGAPYQTSPYLPFGFWFANPTTLYVADEGNPPSYLGGSSPSFQNSTNGTFTLPQLANGSYASDPYAGLEKWSLVNGSWQYDYTIQTGLNLYQPVTINGYNDINGDSLVSYTYGLRNVTGYNNGDGTATLYAITSQFSAVSGGEPDPTSLVGITDQISATTLPNEQFITLQTSAPGEVFRGAAYVPPAPGFTRQSQTITFPTVGPLYYGASPVTLSATAASAWPIAYTLISGPATLSGDVLTVTGVGSVVVQADQSGNTDYSAAPSVQQTITVNPAPTSMNVSVSPSSEEYGADATITITATLSWSGIGVAPTASNINIGGTGPSGYSATSCGAPVSNTITCIATYTPTQADAAGYYTESATFSGDTNYLASTSPQTNNFSIYNANSTTSVALTSGTDPSTYGESQTFTAIITSDTGQIVGASKGRIVGRRHAGANPLFVNGTVTWSSNTGCAPSTVSGYPGTAMCITSVLPGGDDTVTATYANDSSHNGSQGSVLQVVLQASQTITVTTGAPATAAYASSFTIIASASSGLPLAYTSAGSCSNSGATYTMTSSSGTCSVMLNQAGNNDYLAASPVMMNVSATLASQTITCAVPPGVKAKDSFPVLCTGGGSGNPLLYASSGDCANSGSTYTAGTKPGTCAGAINQAGNGDYLPAPPFTFSIPVITKLEPAAVSLTGAPTSAIGGSTFTVTASYPDTPGVPLAGPAITGFGTCSAGAVSGSGTTYTATITMTKGSGTCTTTAKWPANFYYAAATAEEKTSAERTMPTFSFTGAPGSAAGGSQFTVTASSNETGTYASVPTITASGFCIVVSVTNNGPGSYQAIIAMTNSTGMCTTTAKWAQTIEYTGETLTQKTTAE